MPAKPAPGSAEGSQTPLRPVRLSALHGGKAGRGGSALARRARVIPDTARLESKSIFIPSMRLMSWKRLPVREAISAAADPAGEPYPVDSLAQSQRGRRQARRL